MTTSVTDTRTNRLYDSKCCVTPYVVRPNTKGAIRIGPQCGWRTCCIAARATTTLYRELARRSNNPATMSVRVLPGLQHYDGHLRHLVLLRRRRTQINAPSA